MRSAQAFRAPRRKPTRQHLVGMLADARRRRCAADERALRHQRERQRAEGRAVHRREEAARAAPADRRRARRNSAPARRARRISRKRSTQYALVLCLQRRRKTGVELGAMRARACAVVAKRASAIQSSRPIAFARLTNMSSRSDAAISRPSCVSKMPPGTSAGCARAALADHVFEDRDRLQRGRRHASARC